MNFLFNTARKLGLLRHHLDSWFYRFIPYIYSFCKSPAIIPFLLILHPPLSSFLLSTCFILITCFFSNLTLYPEDLLNLMFLSLLLMYSFLINVLPFHFVWPPPPTYYCPSLFFLSLPSSFGSSYSFSTQNKDFLIFTFLVLSHDELSFPFSTIFSFYFFSWILALF